MSDLVLCGQKFNIQLSYSRTQNITAQLNVQLYWLEEGCSYNDLDKILLGFMHWNACLIDVQDMNLIFVGRLYEYNIRLLEWTLAADYLVDFVFFFSEWIVEIRIFFYLSEIFFFIQRYISHIGVRSRFEVNTRQVYWWLNVPFTNLHNFKQVHSYLRAGRIPG